MGSKDSLNNQCPANLEVGWSRKSFNLSRHRSTQRQGDKRSAPQGYLLRGTAADLIASNAPLRRGRHTARQNPPKHYPRGFKGAANRGPAKAQRSGFGGERRSSGTTELLPRKAKRRMWSLRRRGASFSSIFRRAAKDGVPEGRSSRREVVKNVKPIIPAPTAIKQNGSYGAHLHLRNCPF